MDSERSRWLFFLVDDWTWWAWAITALLLAVGLWGYEGGFVGAILLSAAQFLVMLARDRSLAAFPVQLRLAYTLLLILCFPQPMRWLYWLPTLGTFALVFFGYCLMARVLSLLPWNRSEPMSGDLLRRTFFSRPMLPEKATSPEGMACAGGLCTISAQVAPRKHT